MYTESIVVHIAMFASTNFCVLGPISNCLPAKINHLTVLHIKFLWKPLQIINHGPVASSLVSSSVDSSGWGIAEAIRLPPGGCL